MARILRFTAAKARCARRTSNSRGDKLGEIVIFPGIRYEYWDRPQPEPQRRQDGDGERPSGKRRRH